MGELQGGSFVPLFKFIFFGGGGKENKLKQKMKSLYLCKLFVW